METLLQANGIERSYRIGRDTLEVLKGVSLSLLPSRTFAVMGASGSGKSTLLHVLGGLETPNAGQVHFRGKDIYKTTSAWRSRFRAGHIGFVFQSFHLLPELTVLENVALPALISGHTAEGKKMARTLLEEVGLADRLRHRPQELSGGERQRVALARALVNRPELVLADEPTGNLDSATGTKVLDYLFQLIESKGHSLMLVTHSEAVAGRCACTVKLKDGRLVE